MIIKKASSMIQLLVLVLVMTSVLGSLRQMSNPTDYCSGFPCIDNSDCGSACLCNGRLGMCQ